MCDWTGCPGEKENETSATSREQRFTEFASDDKLADLAKGFVPDNTEKNTRWALKNFDLWRKARNTCRPEDSVPVHFFQCTDPKLLNRHLSRFVLETRKSNGERYPPATLHHLLCGLLRHFRQQNPGCPNFMDKKDLRFRELHGTLDAHFHQLHSEGIGRQVQHAEIITKSKENQLWKSGVMGISTPRSLQNAVFYCIDH